MNIKATNKFFDQLEIFEDRHSFTNSRIILKKQCNLFIKKPTHETAFKIYKIFFNAYWIGIQKDENPFIEMIKKLVDYEKACGSMIDGHRDHFLHSVYVFILGLSIYIENTQFQKQFYEFIQKENYKDSYDGKHEEFFYRWGIASLFHDIAYPLELMLKQAKIYSNFLNSYFNDQNDLSLSLNFNGISKYNKLSELLINKEYYKEFYEKYPGFDLTKYISCYEIYASILSNRFQISKTDISKELKRMISDMEEGIFLDHGFYSGLIVMKWYHHLIKSTNWNPAYFAYPVVDAATSILLHNYYERYLMKKPFCLKKLNYSKSPIAFLLILCDELQIWNRVNFCNPKNSLIKADVNINKNKISINYTFSKSQTNDIINDIINKINNILLLDQLEIDLKVKRKGLKWQRQKSVFALIMKTIGTIVT